MKVNINSQPEQGTPDGPEDIRCFCNSLLARRRGDTIELKCRRCRRTLAIRLSDLTVEMAETSAAPGDSRKGKEE